MVPDASAVRAFMPHAVARVNPARRAPVHTAPLPSSAGASPLSDCPPMITSSSLQQAGSRERQQQWSRAALGESGGHTWRASGACAVGKEKYSFAQPCCACVDSPPASSSDPHGLPAHAPLPLGNVAGAAHAEHVLNAALRARQVLGSGGRHVGHALSIHTLRGHVVKVAARKVGCTGQGVVGAGSGRCGSRATRAHAAAWVLPAQEGHAAWRSEQEGKTSPSAQPWGLPSSIASNGRMQPSSHPMVPSAVRPKTAPTAVTTCGWRGPGTSLTAQPPSIPTSLSSLAQRLHAGHRSCPLAQRGETFLAALPAWRPVGPSPEVPGDGCSGPAHPALRRGAPGPPGGSQGSPGSPP